MKKLLLAFFCLPILLFGSTPAPLNFSFPGSSAAVAEAIHQSSFNSYLELLNTSGDSAILEISRIRLGDFSGKKGKNTAGQLQINGKVPAAKYVLKPGEAIRIDITAELPEYDDYQSVLSMLVSWDKKQMIKEHAIKVSYAPKPESPVKEPFFTIDRIAGSRGIAGSMESLLLLNDSGLKGGKIDQISVVVAPDETDEDAGPTRVIPVPLYNMDSVPVSSVTFGEGSHTKQLRIDLSGLDQAGKYKGTVYLNAEDHKQVKQDFSFTLKHPARNALLFIALGLLLAIGFKWLTRDYLPRIKRDKKIQEFKEMAGAKPFPDPDSIEEREAWQTFSGFWWQVLELTGKSDRGAVANIDEAIGRLLLKRATFDEWYVLWQKSRILPPDPEASWSQVMAKAQLFIMHPGTPQPDDQDWPTKVRAQITLIDKQEVIMRGNRFADLIRKDEFLVEKMHQALEAWEKLIAAPENTQAVLENGLRNLQESYLGVLRENMREMATQSPHQSIGKEIWQNTAGSLLSLFHRAENETDPQAVMDIYQAFHLAHLKAIASVLQKSDLGNKERMLADLKAFMDEWPADPSSALKRYRQAISELFSITETTEALDPKHFGIRDGKPRPRSKDRRLAMAGISVIPFETASAVVVRQNEGPDPAKLQQSLRVTKRALLLAELISSGVVAVIALSLGLLLLWQTDATWGGLEDYVYAVLWGFGLHTVNGASSVDKMAFEWVEGKLQPKS